MDALVRAANTQVFAEMSPSQREEALMLLQHCPTNEPRRLVASVRNSYIAKAYGAIQQALTGTTINLYASSDWIERNRPKLPPTRLRYRPDRNEVTLTDGPIDYLIVGSGPAGSVLAHELRRGGKRVVLLEKGSFVVPGSMEKATPATLPKVAGGHLASEPSSPSRRRGQVTRFLLCPYCGGAMVLIERFSAEEIR
jgi:hypothetical protein